MLWSNLALVEFGATPNLYVEKAKILYLCKIYASLSNVRNLDQEVLFFISIFGLSPFAHW